MRFHIGQRVCHTYLEKQGTVRAVSKAHTWTCHYRYWVDWDDMTSDEQWEDDLRELDRT